MCADGGPWGDGWDVVLSVLPLIFLVLVTIGIPKITLKTSRSLPIAALMLWFIRLAYFSMPPDATNALIISGLLEALTPLSIILGAIVLFESAEATKCLAWIMEFIRVLTRQHRVAEVFLIGWSFVVMVEGASGFGTPAALAAPMLVSLGYPAVPTISCVLITDAVVTPFGAVGTPIWFGLDGLGLSDDDLKMVGRKTAIITGVCAYVIVPYAASFLVSFNELKISFIFVLLSITATVAPYIGLSFVSVEFPTLLGGIIGLVLTGGLAYFRVGLSSSPREDIAEISDGSGKGNTNNFSSMENGEKSSFSIAENGGGSYPNAEMLEISNSECNNVDRGMGTVVGPSVRKEMKKVLDEMEVAGKKEKSNCSESKLHRTLNILGRTFPWWATVVILAITRIPQLKVKSALQTTDHSFNAYLGTFAIFSLNPSLVFRLREIFVTEVSWTFQLLYVPFILPFVVVSLITIAMFRRDLTAPWWKPFSVALKRMGTVAIALLGALVLVQLFRIGGAANVTAPAVLVGSNLADWLSDGFIAVSGILGVVGSFFSGSTTVSNLTFGEVQKVAAQNIDRSVTAMLALQTTGATIGNMICINNILAARAVVGVNEPEGAFMRRTLPACCLFWAMGTAVSLIFLLGDVWS